MTDRGYRLTLGIILLGALYAGQRPVIYAFIVMLVLEGLSNWRIPRLIGRLRGSAPPRDAGLAPLHRTARTNLEAERAFRFVVAGMLLLTPYESTWFVPWFVGFALFGAGLSGVCPMLYGLKWAGLR